MANNAKTASTSLIFGGLGITAGLIFLRLLRRWPGAVQLILTGPTAAAAA
jgi:hypothetical protein